MTAFHHGQQLKLNYLIKCLDYITRPMLHILGKCVVNPMDFLFIYSRKWGKRSRILKLIEELQMSLTPSKRQLENQNFDVKVWCI